MCTDSSATVHESWLGNEKFGSFPESRKTPLTNSMPLRPLRDLSSNSLLDELSNRKSKFSVRKIKTLERTERNAYSLRYDGKNSNGLHDGTFSPEMMERFDPVNQINEDDAYTQKEDDGLSRRRLSSSTITISRGYSPPTAKVSAFQFYNKQNKSFSHALPSTTLLNCKSPYGHSMADLTLARTDSNPSIPSKCPSLSGLNLHSSNVELPCSNTTADYGDRPVLNTLKIRTSVGSSHSFLGGHAKIGESQVKSLQNILSEYENNGLPQIPNEYLQFFPQNLSRLQSTDCENEMQVLSQLSQQEKAIFELVQTEANYIRILEMIINVHVSVFIDISNRLAVQSPCSVDYMPPANPSENSVPRSRDSFFGKMRNTKRRRERNSYDLSRTSTVFSYDNDQILYGDCSSRNGSYSSESSAPMTNAFAVFGDIGNVYRANVAFWDDCFKPHFSTSLANVRGFGVKDMKPYFSEFSNYFEPYIEYLQHCGNLVSNIGLMEQENKLFAIFSEWTTNHNYLHLRESLTSFLRKPFQRITRYGLLLQRIKNETSLPDEIKDLEEMCSIVDKFIQKVDAMVPEQDAKKQLELFIKRIGCYSFIEHLPEDVRCFLPQEGADIKNSLRQLIRINGKPVYRKLIMEVSAKVKCIRGKVSNATCVLLTDMILICKNSRRHDRLNVCRPPIQLDRLNISTNLEPPSYILNVRGDLGCTVDVYVLIGDRESLTKWIKAVRNTIKTLTEMKNSVQNQILPKSRISDLDTDFNSSVVIPRLPRMQSARKKSSSDIAHNIRKKYATVPPNMVLPKSLPEHGSPATTSADLSEGSRKTLKQLAMRNREYLNETPIVEPEFAFSQSGRSSISESLSESDLSAMQFSSGEIANNYAFY